MNSFRKIVGFGVILAVLNPVMSLARSESAAIVIAPDATAMEKLAAHEVRRYVYATTGELLPIRTTRQDGDEIVVTRADRPLYKDIVSIPDQLRVRAEYFFASRRDNGHQRLYIVGSDEQMALYGAYALAHQLGVRFYVHGDVIPERRTPFNLQAIIERTQGEGMRNGSPRFALRGIQPFHDFPEGPDWWNTEAYEAIIGQMPKLGMNFIGLHTYPVVEPTVWIGAAEDFEIDDGHVKFSYPTRYYNTALTVGYGYNAKKTSDYSCGGAMLFDRDDFGSDVMRGLTPQPATPEASNEMFDRTGAMLATAFDYAKSLGIKTCVGTETPLVVPEPVKSKWKDAPELSRKMYEGIFARIMKTYSLDYYWLWTPEGWTWEGVKPEVLDATVKDIMTAHDALKTVGAKFQLATCGWVLGPQNDRSLFDRALPKDVAVSCINRAVGHDPVEPGFAQVQGRGKWAIPWLEDDPAMVSAQLWVARMNRDAHDALAYGCDGLMGIHWRTRVLGPNVAALAQTMWAHGDAPAGDTLVDAKAFYDDWAAHEFGPEIGRDAAAVFTAVDGKLPRPSDWIGGPGGFSPDTRPWSEVSKEYAFVDAFAKLGARVRSKGDRERFEYWRDTFEFLRETGRMRCLYFAVSESMKKAKAETDTAKRKQIARDEVLPQRMALVTCVRDAYGHLLGTVNTLGEMGTVCNFEQHTFPVMLDAPGKELEAMLGESLPADARLPKEYGGAPRLFVPIVRTSLRAGEPLKVTAVVLDARQPRAVTLHIRALGTKKFAAVAFGHEARNTFRVEIDRSKREWPGGDFEYFVDAKSAGGKKIVWPAGAPRTGQTVVVE